MRAAARASLAAALQDSLPHCSRTAAERIADALIWRWERDGWFAVTVRPPAARKPRCRCDAAPEPAADATRAA